VVINRYVHMICHFLIKCPATEVRLVQRFSKAQIPL